MAKYDFTALPVLGPTGGCLGVITVDDVMDVLTQEQTEDVQKLAAVEPLEEAYFQTDFWTFIRKRGAVARGRSSSASSSPARRSATTTRSSRPSATLSFYVPLLISTGGNSGSQSASLIIRGLAVGDIKPSSDWRNVLVREPAPGRRARAQARASSAWCACGCGATGRAFVVHHRRDAGGDLLMPAAPSARCSRWSCGASASIPRRASTPFIATPRRRARDRPLLHDRAHVCMYRAASQR